MKKSVVLKTIPLLFFVPAMAAAATTQLSSCSIFVPRCNISAPVTQDWMAETTFDVTNIWEGYYYDDVNDPVEVDGINYNGHEYNEDTQTGDIKLDTTHPDITGKHEDSVNKVEMCTVRFIVMTDKLFVAGGDNDGFDISVTWTIKHTSYKYVTTTKVVPYKGIITINDNWNYASAPSIDASQIDPNELTNNSVNFVDGVYNDEGGNTLGHIRNNIKNDLCWWQYLLYSSLKNIYIDNTLSGTHTSIDSSSWKVHVDLEYQPAEQLFSYIHIHLEGSGDVSVYGIPGTANAGGDYYWGSMPDSTSKSLPESSGPRLLGAFTPNSSADFAHFPQGYDPSATSLPVPIIPYTQNFLSLVPSTTDSYQLYDFQVLAKTILGTSHYSSGYHSYFLQQPRMFGLEYRTGQSHIALKTRGGTDSFGGLGLNIPSFALSGMGYDKDKHPETNGFYSQFDPVTIKQCKTNIDTIKPVLTNYLSPGDAATFSKHGFLQPYPNDEWTYDLDSNNEPIDPTSFIQQKIAEYSLQDSCITADGSGDDWRNLTISGPDYTPNSRIGATIPYYQVIQQQSTRAGDGEEGKRTPGNRFANYKNSAVDNIQWSGSAFSVFGAGLNYMFTSDSLVSAADADNLFTYADPSSIPFNNNPS